MNARILTSRIAAGISIITSLYVATPEVGLAQSAVPLLPLPARDANESADVSFFALKIAHAYPKRQDTLRRFVGPGGPISAPTTKIHKPKDENRSPNPKKSTLDLQVNDPTLDHSQRFAGANPFEFATESETTVCADKNHIVTSYNTSAGANVVEFEGQLFYSQLFLSGYSVSHDGGKTWKSGFVAPPVGSIGTFGDGVVAKDRKGNFYYAGLGLDANFAFGILVGKSTDHGDTFAPSQVVALDDGGDKEWIAAGPNPLAPATDNVYLTWTSFSDTGSVLMFSRSTDSGATWSAPRTIYTPIDNGGDLSSYMQFSNPVVDPSTGRLYVPFLHGGNINDDYMRVLISDDGGQTFTQAAFNVPGAPDAWAYPVVAPGIGADCGSGGIRLVVKQGSDIGGGIWGQLYGFPRFVHCTRLIDQPATAADRGRVAIALNSSTSQFVSDPTAGSQIVVLYSSNGGRNWGTTVAAPSTAADPQHFHPAVSLANNGNKLYVGYYVQQANEKIRTDFATLQSEGNRLGDRASGRLSSVAFDLAPNNVPDPNDSTYTVNFDQLLIPGYSLGEYMGVATDDSGNAIATWGDSRQSWVSPADGFFPGSHPQSDVYFRKVGNKEND